MSSPSQAAGDREIPSPPSHSAPHNCAAALTLAALGIIYGDISTSPLYTIKECFSGKHGLEPNPVNVLATVSTIIASQAMISGVYSLTQQAMQLGFVPRMRIVHTSAHARGQIYMPMVNWMVMFACLSLVLVFRESGNLAAAYGFAVTGTMTITSVMYFQITRYKWGWSLWQNWALVGLFLFFDISFLGANVLKIFDGGWITICIATFIATSMIAWRDGRETLRKHYGLMRLPTDIFLRDLKEYSPSRTVGTAVFMSISPVGIPHTLLHHLKHTESLHERVMLLSVLPGKRRQSMRRNEWRW
jgi:KUP system potassium uptake protein